MKNQLDKIYAYIPEDDIVGTASTKKGIPHQYIDIEYVRKDAFIEKACDFFEENIKEEDCKIGGSEWTELRAEYKSLDSFIRAFVEYMKGEKV